MKVDRTKKCQGSVKCRIVLDSVTKLLNFLKAYKHQIINEDSEP
jgi:hypothetical protein